MLSQLWQQALRPHGLTPRGPHYCTTSQQASRPQSLCCALSAAHAGSACRGLPPFPVQYGAYNGSTATVGEQPACSSPGNVIVCVRSHHASLLVWPRGVLPHACCLQHACLACAACCAWCSHSRWACELARGIVPQPGVGHNARLLNASYQCKQRR